MSQEVRLAQLSAGLKDAVIIAWLRKEGDTLSKGEPLLQVETDKAVMEIESPADGVLTRIIHGKGAKLTASTVLAVIE